jgi:NAD(P)-dependent dehydrogenase (short-subunit alcohol dehydrogenase family)
MLIAKMEIIIWIEFNFQFPGVLAYNISKAALDQFTRCVALELAPKQVRVNAVK